MGDNSISSEDPKQYFAHLWLDETVYPAVLPRSMEDVMHVITWCRLHKWKLLIVGKGHSFSADFRVAKSVLTLVSTARDGISATDFNDLTVEVESGALAADVDRYVQHNGFRLSGWPNNYPGTVGGLICGKSGLGLRRLIQGVDFIDGRAKSMRFGGRVRKNVSGFDVAGLFAGSRGQIGWLDRVFLRLTPLKAPTMEINNKNTNLSTENTDIFRRLRLSFDPDDIFLKSLS